jgi:LmbE family N-acetylglucosaminyl deacetylase
MVDARLTGIVGDMAIVVLSPHLDDAVLSCWHVLTKPGELTVINLFTGVPAGLDAPAWWDQYTSATDSAERVRERIEEDRRALALAGRTAVNLGFLDEQYRHEAQPLGALTEQIERLLAPGVRIYAPAAFANHADHALVRAAALELRAAGFAVSLYADLPHATVHGWPAWVTGRSAPATKDLAGAMWDEVLAGTGAMAPAVHHLHVEDYARKLRAVRMYGTQLQALTALAGRPLTDRATLGYEVAWSTASRAGAGERLSHRL